MSTVGIAIAIVTTAYEQYLKNRKTTFLTEKGKIIYSVENGKLKVEIIND